MWQVFLEFANSVAIYLHFREIITDLVTLSLLLVIGVCFLLRESGPLQVGPRRFLPARGLHEVFRVRRFESVCEGQVSGEVNHVQFAVRARRPDVVNLASETWWKIAFVILIKKFIKN